MKNRGTRSYISRANADETWEEDNQARRRQGFLTNLNFLEGEQNLYNRHCLDPLPLLFLSIRPTPRSFFTNCACLPSSRESEKHKKEEGDDTAPFHSLPLSRSVSLCNHDDGGRGRAGRQNFSICHRAVSFALEVERKTNVSSSPVPFHFRYEWTLNALTAITAKRSHLTFSSICKISSRSYSYVS